MARARRPPRRRRSADRAIALATLARLREDYAARRVRHALEAYRLTRGRWPERLSDLASAGLLPPERWRRSGGDPYYSMDRDRATVFLAPES